MSSNNLIVGLGGTGGKVIASMRRLMQQHHGSPEPRDIALDYLYIDTSKRETDLSKHGTGVAANDKRWRYLGHSVQLGPAQVVHLNNSSFGSIVKNSENYPHISSWLGDSDVWARYWDSQKGEMEAAGQIRRFGRIVLAQNLDRARDGIKSRMNALREKNGINKWRFHVVAGLAGGTGSGTFLDVVRLIRHAARGEDASIVLYSVLPEAEDSPWSNGNYHANGYAALSELNAMQVERLKLHGISNDALEPEIVPAVNGAWLITNKNDQGIRFDVGKTLPNLTAEALYQVYIASGEANIRGGSGPAANANDERSWLDVPSGENRPADFVNEKDDPANPDIGPFDRFNNFISFGIKTIAVPVEEITEYSSFAFMRQFVLQALNNSWVQGSGFAETNRRLDHAAISKDKDKWEKWLFTDKHLKLEVGSLANDSKWRSLGDEFGRGINGKATEIQGIVKDTAAWPRAIEEHAREFYENNFRTSGVQKFYTGADRSKSERAQYIVRERMSADLFEQWSSGEYSIRNVAEIVKELQRETEERRAGCDERIGGFSKREDEINKSLGTLKREYSKLGIIGFPLKGKKTFSQIVQTLIELNTVKAQRAAYNYMQSLLVEIADELSVLRGDVERIEERFEEALEEINKAIASRVDGDDVNPSGSGQYKFYKPDLVQSVVGQLERKEELQKDQSGVLRHQMIESIGGQRSFRNFADKASRGMVINTLEEAATQQAVEALENIEADRDKILERSIIEKLAEEYGNQQEKLSAFLALRAAEAQPLAAIDSAQRNMTNPNWSGTVTIAFVPSRESCPDNLRDFHEQLTRSLRNAVEGMVHIVETEDQPERIVILSFLHRFPLRMLSNVGYIKDLYHKRLSGQGEKLARMMLHAEGDGGNLSPLYAASITDYRAKAEPYWLIAQCMGLLKDQTNAETGRNEALLEYIDTENFGDRTFRKVGSSVETGASEIQIDDALILMRVVKERLAEMKHVDERSRLIAELGSIRDAALTAAGNNPTAERFKEVDDKVKAARQLVAS